MFKKLNRVTSFLLMAIPSVLIVVATHADDQPSPPSGQQLSKTDLGKLTEFFKQYTYAFTKPVYVYHWSGTGSSYDGAHSASDPQAFGYVNGSASGYWGDQGTDGGDNMFGRGLYAAVDPVATRSYGNADWTLVQMKIEPGFRMLDLRQDGANSVPMDIENILEKAGCPSSLVGNANALNQIFAPKPKVSQICLDTLKSIFDGELKIDGFAYSYSSTNFDACKPAPDSQAARSQGYFGGDSLRGTAFVMTNSNAFKPDDVRLFTKNTTDDVEDRTRIETMFYKGKSDGGYPQVPSSVVQAATQANPGCQYWGINQHSSGGTRSWTMQFNCNGVTKSVPIPPQAPAGTKMSNSSPPTSRGSDQGLLWNDLDGKEQDPQIDDWMKKSLYGCGADAPYVPIANYHPPAVGIVEKCHPGTTQEPAMKKVYDLNKAINKMGIITK